VRQSHISATVWTGLYSGWAFVHEYDHLAVVEMSLLRDCFVLRAVVLFWWRTSHLEDIYCIYRVRQKSNPLSYFSNF